LNIAPHHEGLTTGAQGAEAVDAGFLECSFRLFRSASEPELIAYDLAIVLAPHSGTGLGFVLARRILVGPGLDRGGSTRAGASGQPVARR